MDTLDGLKAVVAAVETGSFTNAGQRLDWSKALVSKYIAQVEADLGVRLFNRSTRKLALTESGQRYYEHALQILAQFDQFEDQIKASSEQVSGHIKFSTSVSFGELLLAPVLPEFMARYPELTLDIQLSDNKLDLLENGIDLALRIGSIDDSRLIARTINQVSLLLCASPEYLSKHGTPTHAQDLSDHLCVIDSNFKIGNRWRLVDDSGEPHVIDVPSKVQINNPKAVKEMVRRGAGIGLISELIVRDELESGDLVPLLTNYQTLHFDMVLLYPHRQYLPQKVRCLIEFLIEKFGE